MDIKKKIKALSIVFLLFLLNTTIAYTQEKYKDKGIQTKNGFDIVATNPYIYPISVKFDLKLTNLKPSIKNGQVVVVPPKTIDYKLFSLKVIPNKSKYGYSYATKISNGDVFIEKYDTDYPYELPFEKGKSFRIDQGYNGRFSHKNVNAIDFKMPIGTKILAAREGSVVKVIDNFSKNCRNIKCAKKSNSIVIFHSDGTFGTYAHIKQGSALVKEGSFIKKGQPIAYSGNVGYSTGPHLHFEVYIPKIDNRQSLKTKFLIKEGVPLEELKENNSYYKVY